MALYKSELFGVDLLKAVNVCALKKHRTSGINLTYLHCSVFKEHRLPAETSFYILTQSFRRVNIFFLSSPLAAATCLY